MAIVPLHLHSHWSLLNGVHCTILKKRHVELAADIQGLFFLEYADPTSLAERLSRWIENQVTEAERPSDLEPSRLTKLLDILTKHFNQS